MEKKREKVIHLTDEAIIKGQTMYLLARSCNTAIFYNTDKANPIRFAVAKIRKFVDDSPYREDIEIWEDFIPFDYKGIRIGWIIEDFDSAFDLFKKLVRENDYE